MSSIEPLLIEDSTLCVLSHGATWDDLGPAVALAADWTNQSRWQQQRSPFTLSGQRTLIVQARRRPGASNFAVKIKGHHFVWFEPTRAAMIFRYGALERPSLRPYSGLAEAGPFLPSGHCVNAGWWSCQVKVDAGLQLTYTPPPQDVPCGAMRLEAALHELEMADKAHQLGCSPFFPVACGRYRASFAGKPTGFQIMAGPFGRDLRAQGLFKGVVIGGSKAPRVWLPVADLRRTVATFTGKDEAAMEMMDDPRNVRDLWVALAGGLGSLLRDLHRRGICHGVPDFGNLVVIGVSKGTVRLSLCDWEEAVEVGGRHGGCVTASCVADLLSGVHAVVLEGANNPFFASVTSADEMSEAIFAAYSGDGIGVCRGAARQAVELVRGLVCAANQCPGAAALPASLVRLVAV